MKTKKFIGNCSSRWAYLYLIDCLLLFLILGGCDNDSRKVVGTQEPTEEPEPTEEAIIEDLLPAGKKHGNISVSEDGKTIYVHGWVYVYELSDHRTKKAKKIIFCKDAGICWEEPDGFISYFAYLDSMVEEVEVEEGNPFLYAEDGMLVKRKGADEYTDSNLLIFCVPGRKGNVRVPEGVQSIDSCAFFGCSGITSISLPASLEGIYDGAFAGMKSCTSIQADKDDKKLYTKDGVLYYRKDLLNVTLIAYPAGKTDRVYKEAPEDTTKISGGAFLGADHLREVYLPSRVRTIRDAAFQRCKNLRKVIVKNHKRISDVEGNVFDDCPKLKEHVKDKYEL